MVLKHEAETEGLSRETELKQRVLPGSRTKNAKTLARGPLSSSNLTWAENLIHLQFIISIDYRNGYLDDYFGILASLFLELPFASILV